MPPFKNAEEKRQFILDNKYIFEALKIDLTKEKIDEIVDDPSKNEDYAQANAILNDLERSETESREYFNYSPELRRHGLLRLPILLYDTSDTPEAKKWNEDLKAIVEGENASRKLVDLCLKTLLEFDDTVMGENKKNAAKFFYNNIKLSYFIFGVVDVGFNLTNLYDMNNPKEAAIVNAFNDKFLVSQALNFFNYKVQYDASKLSLILPDLSMEQATTVSAKLLERMNAYQSELKRNNPDITNEELEDAVVDYTNMINAVNAKLQFHIMDAEFDAYAPAVKKLVDVGQIGPDGYKYRAYKMNGNVKEYLNKDKQVKALIKDAKMPGIKFEEISKEAKDGINDLLATTPKIGVDPVWPDRETKSLYMKALRPLYEAIKPKMTDAQVEGRIDNNVTDYHLLKQRDIKDKIKVVDMDFRVSPETNIGQAARMTNAFLLDGSTTAIKEWNENVKLLAQSDDGLAKLARIAAKRLLQVDMRTLIQKDIEARRQYLFDHPVERQLFFLTFNIIEAYKSTLPKGQKDNDPVVTALTDRKVLFEAFNDDAHLIKANASRVKDLFLDLNADECMMMSTMLIGKRNNAKDPKMFKLYDEAHNDLASYYHGQKDVLNNAGREMGERLFNEGFINNETLNKRVYIEVTKKDENGNDVTEKQYYSFYNMIEAISTGKLSKEDFHFEPVSPASIAAIDKLINETPDNPVFTGTAEEKARAHYLAEQRIIKYDNDKKMDAYAKAKSEDMTLDPELRELYANALKAEAVNTAGEALAYAFKYVNEHTKYDSSPLAKEKLEVALNTVAMLDGSCFKELVERVNLDRQFGGWLSSPTIDSSKILSKSGIKPGQDVEKQTYNFRDPFDKRVQNVKEVYDLLTKKLDPWYHVNSKEFDNMLKKMRNVLDYATISNGADKNTIEKMLEEVTTTAKEYTLHKGAFTDLSKKRRSAAIAVVAALDPKEGEKLLATARENKSWVASVASVITNHKGEVALNDFTKYANVTEALDKQEVLNRMNQDITKSKNIAKEMAEHQNDEGVDEAAAKRELAEISAQTIVKEKIYESIKQKNIDHVSIINEMSRTKVNEASEKILQDDVYRTVLNKMKINQDQPCDKVIDIIEANYKQAKLNKLNDKQAENNNIIHEPAVENQKNDNPAMNAPKVK